ncbi:MAG: sugar phosphate nucleotidyltransferase [Fervidobacterium sp.]|uniref:sugar phosphate nucleotidyltransferase n=1 Tax=Fervidobacterium TaxID=2422 RepID=UPI00309C06AD
MLACGKVENSEGIVTFGIVPTRPEMGYGYIEVDEKLNEKVYSVKMFREKPSYETAVEYVSSGRFFWNSGMFMWKKRYFVEQMKKHAKEVIEPFLTLEGIEEIYTKVPSISIDYALMEKADKIYTIKADFVWSDVGNWKSLQELGVKNSPNTVLIDSNAFVQTTKPTIVIGVNNVVVVETENGILVADESQLEKIREALKRI